MMLRLFVSLVMYRNCLTLHLAYWNSCTLLFAAGSEQANRRQKGCYDCGFVTMANLSLSPLLIEYRSWAQVSGKAANVRDVVEMEYCSFAGSGEVIDIVILSL